MHDQRKKEEVLNPDEQAAAAAEHERVGVLYRAVLHTSKVHDYSIKTLEDTEKLLLAVPDAYTAYNCRRHALNALWDSADRHTTGGVATQKEGEGGSAAAAATNETSSIPELTRQEWLLKELKLNSTVLLMNYKNYNAFVHRHWVFDQFEALAKAELLQQVRESSSTATSAVGHPASPTGAASNAPAAAAAASSAGIATTSATAPKFVLLRQLLQKERAQCEQLLQMDERNFHAWNYRRWVLAQEHRANALAQTCHPVPPSSPLRRCEGADPCSPPDAGGVLPTDATPTFTADEAAELAYTTQKIKHNFSNYSAWHQRSLALKTALARWQALLAGHTDNPRTETKRRECHAVLLVQLREDVGFLEQAIYCDPNDQSAWFYAPFVLQLLRHTALTQAEAAEAAALTDVFVSAVIELIAEVDRTGGEDDCYMPYYFLLDQLIHLKEASENGDGECGAAVTRYTHALSRKLSSLSVEGQEGMMCGTQHQCRCFSFLHERLCKADALRKGLYDDMLKRATQGTA
jgi:geranylgeranyl transferase type-2 subunit alpha